MTPEKLLALATINPELDEILKKSPPLQGLTASTDVVALRENLAAAKKKFNDTNKQTGDVPYVEEDRTIPVRDGSSITVRIHSPKSPPKDGSPIFVVYHGGGFCLGGLDNEAVLCRKFTELGGIAVNVDYRLAPEHPFPVPVHDAYDALKWTAEHFKELGGNLNKGFLIGGISAGANFSSVLPHLYRDDKLSPPLTGVFLSITSAFAPELVPAKYKELYLSREQNKDAPILNAAAMGFFDKLYKPDSKSPLRSPIVFESHKDLPPTYFQICGLDPLRDEALIYEEILREENGIKTRVDIYPGLPHSFWSFFPEASFSKKLQADNTKALKWLLGYSE